MGYIVTFNYQAGISYVALLEVRLIQFIAFVVDVRYPRVMRLLIHYIEQHLK